MIAWILAGIEVAVLTKLLHKGLKVEPYDIEVTRHTVRFENLPAHLEGFTICQLSDLHICGKPRNEHLVAQLVREIDADLWVLTGDMIYRQEGIARFAQWWDSLNGHCTPAVAVLGNAEHKSYVRTPDIEKALTDRGITLLNNASVQLPVKDATLQIVGVDDPHTYHSDFAKAYADADPTAFTLLLCHSPDGVAERAGLRTDLMLCGHTHGGQVRFKGLPALHNTKKVKGLLAGWYRGEELRRKSKVDSAGVQMFISRGISANRFPIRIGCRPEIAVFTLAEG